MTERTPGQAAREAFGELGADWYPGTPWNGLHADLRAQWEAAANAAIAEVVNPTAQDYDNAAEIMRLREALAEAAAHVEPVDQNSELAIARWQALAAGES